MIRLKFNFIISELCLEHIWQKGRKKYSDADLEIAIRKVTEGMSIRLFAKKIT